MAQWHTFRTSRKRRFCQSSQLCERPIERGDRYCVAVVSLNDAEVGNEGWWRAALCLSCAAYYGYKEPV